MTFLCNLCNVERCCGFETSVSNWYKWISTLIGLVEGRTCGATSHHKPLMINAKKTEPRYNLTVFLTRLYAMCSLETLHAFLEIMAPVKHGTSSLPSKRPDPSISHHLTIHLPLSQLSSQRWMVWGVSQVPLCCCWAPVFTGILPGANTGQGRREGPF